MKTSTKMLASVAIVWVLRAMINTHTHLREDSEDEVIMEKLINFAAIGGAAVLGPMPNTVKGLLKAEDVSMYIYECEAKGESACLKLRFIKFVQITENTTVADIVACVKAGIRDGKVYPLGRTTQSQNGVRDYIKLIPILQEAGRQGMRIHFHPELPLMSVENRDAEYQFVPIMDMLIRATEESKTVLIWEHGTDGRCIHFWEEWAKTGRFYVTLTAHHLATNESETFGDVQATCKPPIKTTWDQKALVALVCKGYVWVMAGGDDAPHPKEKKHVHGKCACGAYTAPFLYALYAHALSELLTKKMDVKKFEKFMYENAAKLYDIDLESLPKVVLTKQPMTIPKTYQAGTWTIESFWGGKEIGWTLTMEK